MFKKLFGTGCLFLGCLSSAIAGSFYLVPMLAYVDYKISGNNIVRFQGLAPKFEAGYEIPMNPFYIGLEAGVIPLKPLTIHNVTSSGVATLTPNWTVDASITPGVDLDGYIRVFGRAGFVRTNFQNYGSKSSGELGAGIDVVLSGCWSVRGEYIYTSYRNSSIVSQEGAIGALLRF